MSVGKILQLKVYDKIFRDMDSNEDVNAHEVLHSENGNSTLNTTAINSLDEKLDYENNLNNNVDVIEQVKVEIENGLNKKEAIKKVAKRLGVNKNEVYKQCTNI